MSQQPTYGSYNPHSLSTLRTERAWEGKYDEPGDRCEAHSASGEIPVQKIPVQKIYDRLGLTPPQLMEFCQKWQIAELAVFGSILRDDFRADGDDPSDIDLLFRYLPNTNMSLLRRARMKIEMEKLCQRPVDLVLFSETIASHNLNRKKYILESARLIYVKR